MIITSTISPVLKIGLQLMGIWPGVPHPIYWLIFVPSTLYLQYFQYTYAFMHFKQSELSNLADSLPEAFNYSLSLTKMASLWIHRRIARHILTTIDRDWRECNVEQHLYLMTIKANIAHFCSNAILSLNMIAITFYLFTNYVIGALHITEDYNNTLRKLPLKLELPFETSRSPSFELISMTLASHTFLNVFTLSIINALIFTLVFHAGGQIDIMCQELRAIPEKNSLHGSFAFTLGILIERHNRIISFSDDTEALFSFMALMQAFWNTLTICCLGFIIIISIHSENAGFVLLKTVLVYVGVMMEAFVFCFAGEYLSLKSKSIADAAYDSLWYNMPSKQGKVISLMIMRSQKPLAVTAGGITNLSLETFTNMMKASASYISVLHAMY